MIARWIRIKLFFSSLLSIFFFFSSSSSAGKGRNRVNNYY